MARERWDRLGGATRHDDIGRYWRELADLAAAMPLDALTRAVELLLDCRARPPRTAVHLRPRWGPGADARRGRPLRAGGGTRGAGERST